MVSTGSTDGVAAANAGELLDAVQQQVVSSTTHTLLLGSAGTGKTTALQGALAEAARRDGATAVLGLAPTRADARRWQARLAALLGGTGLVPPVLTVSGLATRVLTAGDPAGDPDALEPRILTAPEQESRIREILAGTRADWPPELKPALATRSFARRLRRIVAQARWLDWDPDRLQEVAARQGDPLWVAIGQFLEEYLAVLDWEGSVDHAEVVLRAARRLEAGLPSPFAGISTVVADDAQDWSRTHARLVLAVSPPAAVIVAADPDRAAASYRGGDLSALDVLRAAGTRLLVADTTYRGGARMRDARAALMADRGYGGLPAAVMGPYRRPTVALPTPDVVVAVEYDDAASQSRHVADHLWRAHHAGTPWREMAVLANSPAEHIPLLARTLAQAQIPVHVPAGDVPLAQQSAVATLLGAAGLVLRDDWRDATAEPEWLALAAADPVALAPRQLRRLRRWLVSRYPDSATMPALGRHPARAALAPDDMRAAAAAVVHLAERLAAARACHERGGTPAEVLWLLWHGTGPTAGEWPDRLRRRAEGAGEAALAAGRQLDAVVALFRLAERAPQRWGGTRGLRALVTEIEHQEIPAEPDLKAEPATDAVTVLSLHRARGRCWPVVVVTGLEESCWRTSGLTGGPLDPGRLTDDDLLPVAPASTSAEQRRRFNAVLGCADRELVLAACGGPDDPPTGFLAAAGIPVTRVAGLPPTPRTPVELMLGMRRAASTADPRTREPAVAALRTLLAARRADGSPAFPSLAADRWGGVRDWTQASQPLRDPNRPLALSASGIEAIEACPLRWFWQREARADRTGGRQAGFGLLVHAAAADLVRSGAAESEQQRQALVHDRWTGDGYDAGWHERRERDLAVEAVDRAGAWLSGRSGDLRAEQPVDAVVAVRDDGGEVVDRIHVRGSVDLVERTAQGVVVWDYKTRRTPASRAEVDANVQLAVYQAALAGQSGPVLAAGLVQLCVPAGTADLGSPKVRQQSGLSADDTAAAWVSGVLHRAAGAVRVERFAATPGPGCRTCAFRDSCPAMRPGSRA